MENGEFTNAFTDVKAINTAANGRYPTQNAQHFVPIILHSPFSILNFNSTFSHLLQSFHISDYINLAATACFCRRADDNAGAGRSVLRLRRSY